MIQCGNEAATEGSVISTANDEDGELRYFAVVGILGEAGKEHAWVVVSVMDMVGNSYNMVNSTCNIVRLYKNLRRAGAVQVCDGGCLSQRRKIIF